MSDKTCMSYWFPKIEAAGLPVPRTTLLTMPRDALSDLFLFFDGEKPKGLAEPFFEEVKSAAAKIGYPIFLRTGHTSGKHDWERTCFVSGPNDVLSHVVNLIEFSEMASLIGMPLEIWAVREMLQTIPFGTCKRYHNMPICREFRFFVDDGEIQCWHPYWPLDSLLKQGRAEFPNRIFDYGEFCALENETPLREIAIAAGKAVGGAWSVDLLETENGWFLIDMAEAHKSWHWPECERAAA